jgi:threonyl-tRNA synthetase
VLLLTALQTGMEQMPQGATIIKQQCEEIQVDFNLPRHRCTIWYTDLPAATPTPPASGGSSQP